MAGSWVLGGGCSRRVRFEDEVASGENWNLKAIGWVDDATASFIYNSLVVERYKSRRKGIILVHISS
jgi:hypothetical protein